MRQEQLLPDLIYEYFVMHFHSQFYNYGDTLPTIEELSQECCVSLDTVKTALKRLRKDGYVTTQSRKGIKVAFSQSEKERNAYIAHFFSQRHSAMLDLSESAESILLSLLTEGLCRIDDKDFTSLFNWVDKIRIDDYAQFYFSILKKLNNPLVMNLFWEMILFQGTSMLYQENDYQKSVSDMVRQSLREILLSAQKRDRKRLPELINTSGKEVLKTFTKCNLSNLSFSEEEKKENLSYPLSGVFTGTAPKFVTTW